MRISEIVAGLRFCIVIAALFHYNERVTESGDWMQAETKDVFGRIMDGYCNLTPSETKLADYILRNRFHLHSATVSSLAASCGVSLATVTRFCRSIGCGGFQEFKFEVAQSNSADTNRPSGEGDIDLYGEIAPSDSIEQKCQKLYNISKQALTQTLAQVDYGRVDAAVQLLCEANNVYCFGQGNSNIVAMDAWGRFASVSPKFHWVPDAHLQADTAAILGDKDVVLYFSFSGMTREVSEIGSLVRGTKAKMLLVTRFPASQGAAFADILLVCGADESIRQQGTIAAKISQLFLIDILYNEYCSRNLKLTRSNREKALAATTAMMVGKKNSL